MAFRFSVIVPCYNVEAYVDECIQSILAQTFNDYEVIMVDDGSTDRTHIKCEEWCIKDSRIKLITKTNGGLSSARNAGLEVASGEYIVFVDSDDTIKNESLYFFDRVLHSGTDVLITRLAEDYSDRFIEQDFQLVKYDGMSASVDEAIEWIMNKSQSTWPSVKYVISNEMIKKNNLRFKIGIINEDIEWTTRVCTSTNNYVYCGYLWYIHRMNRTGSISTLRSSKQITDVIDIAYEFIDGNERSTLRACNDRNRRIIELRLMKSVYASLAHYKNMDSVSKKRAIAYINEHKSIFRYAPYFRHRLFNIVMKLCGVRIAMEMYELLT